MAANPNFELLDGFGIPVNQFWNIGPHHEPPQCYEEPPRLPKLNLEPPLRIQNLPKRQEVNTRQIDSILTHPKKTGNQT